MRAWDNAGDVVVAVSTVVVVAVVVAIVAVAALLMYILPRGRRWRRPWGLAFAYRGLVWLGTSPNTALLVWSPGNPEGG